MVDAVTTLLLPANRISYNKAAGADTRERDLRSYVQGHYKSERNEMTGTSRPVGLRGRANVLGAARRASSTPASTTTVTLAQVFWMREGQQGSRTGSSSSPTATLTIATRLRRLRRRSDRAAAAAAGAGAQGVRPLPRVRPGPAPPARHRVRAGLELFHQTVSMKSVDNLNDFVRSHMLEPFDAGGWIDRLVRHFEDLTRAHEAVVRAREQLERLRAAARRVRHARRADRADDRTCDRHVTPCRTSAPSLPERPAATANRSPADASRTWTRRRLRPVDRAVGAAAGHAGRAARRDGGLRR